MRLLISGIFASTLCVNVLSSCSKQNTPSIDEIAIDISKENSVQFTNNLLTDKPKATFKLNLSGTCQFGDVLQVSIAKQTLNNQPCSLISLSKSSYQIHIVPDQTSFDVEVELSDGVLNDIYEIKFTLSFTLIRSGIASQKISVDNLFFENATPTYDDMWDIYDKEGVYVLQGFKDTRWVKDALLKCNTMIIPTNIDVIDDNAFFKEGASTIPQNIKKIVFGSPIKEFADACRLTKIGEKAFANCDSFEFGITFPNSLKYIGSEAFANCSNITGSISFLEESQIVFIGSQAFYGDKNLTGDLLLPSALSTLGDKAFYGCGFDGTLHINSKTLKYISPYAFSNCEQLRQVTCDVNQPLSLLNHSFDNCINLVNIQDLMNNIDFIGEYAFTKCKSIESIKPPFSIKQIADGAFSDCDNLSLIDFSSITPDEFDNLTWQGRYIFSNGNLMGTVNVNTSDMIQQWKDWFLFEETLEDYQRLKNWTYVPLQGDSNV